MSSYSTYLRTLALSLVLGSFPYDISAQPLRFAPGGSYHSGSSDVTSSGVAIDLIGNGCPDIILSQSWGGTVGALVRFTNGERCSGRFHLSERISTGATYVSYGGMPTPGASAGLEQMLALDANNDGLLDIVGITHRSGVVALLNNGAGGFQPARISATPEWLSFRRQISGAFITTNILTSLDLDRDGAVDLALLGVDDDGLTALFMQGQGDGTFQALGEIDAANASSIVSADLDRDGSINELIVTAGRAPFTGGILQFTEPLGSINYFQLPQGEAFQSPVIGDFNGDKLPDIAVTFTAANPSGTSIALLLNRSEGSTLTFERRNLNTRIDRDSLAADDIDGDGIHDLIATLSSQNGIAQAFLLNADGTIRSVSHADGCDETRVPAGQTCNQNDFGVMIEVADINKDGRKDIIQYVREDDLGDQRLLISEQLFPGNMNCLDKRVNNFDINAFVLAFTNEQAYRKQFPACLRENGDLNADGRVDLFDIDPFVELLSRQ